MRTEHTPGPWGITSNETLGSILVLSQKLTPIAAALPLEPLRSTTGHPVSEKLANADLIAAAPDLLKVLLDRCPRCRDGVPFGTNRTIIRVVSAASGKPIAYHQTDTSPRLPCGLTEAERAAVAKARGIATDATTRSAPVQEET